MSHSLIALMLAAGVGAWVYNKIMRTTGNNTKTSLIVGGMVGVLVFLLGLTAANVFLK